LGNTTDTKKYLELSKKLNSITDPIARINLLMDMSVELRNYDIERTVELSLKIIEESREVNYMLGLGRGINLRGWCYWQQGNYELGLQTLQHAEKIARQANEQLLLARIYNNYGHIFRDTGELGKALSNFENALEINESMNEESALAVNLSSIAYIHYDLYEYETALEFALRALPILTHADNMHRLYLVNNILGNIYFKREELYEALNYFEQNLQKSDSATGMHALALNGIGKVNYKLKHYDKARYYLQQGLKEADETSQIEVQISCRYYLALIEIALNNLIQAEKFLLAALDMSVLYLRRHDQMSINETLSVLYDKMGNIPKAFNHLKTFESLKEEIFQQTTLNKLSNLKLRQEVELAKKEKEVAQKTAELKQQFLANMSHEIRTPMNAIVGITQLLLEKDPKPEQMKYLTAISQSADNLLVIINDILDVAKIEAGKMNIEQTRFSLNDIIASIEEMLRLKVAEKKLAFIVQLDDTIPEFLIGDPTRLQQILINLLSNAVKFTEQGSVTIKIGLENQVKNTYYIRFDIIDTGIGISNEAKESIFESFTQASADTTRKFGGTGLGLSISKQLTSLMKGTIHLESELGKGSVFSVIIPFVIAAPIVEHQSKSLSNSSLVAQLENKIILLVEDNEFNQLVAIDTLKTLIPGIIIELAVNGAEAVAKVKNKHYDIVLMDIRMPIMDGIEATQLIRKLDSSYRDTKIIAMTANVMDEDVKTYFKIGINEYVAKPFDQRDLLLKMAKVLGYQTESVVSDMPSQPKSHREIPNRVVDLAFLKQFTNDDTGKIHKYINMFLDNAPKLLKQINDGLEINDYSMVKIAAHSLKPQLGYMGIPEEVSHVFLLEQSAGTPAHANTVPELSKHLELICHKAFEELKIILIQ
jgi:signal transduction histidine kinase/CheY-like chemotaxis protein/HPt (histidine-containing phosphotransfer) domain-containing protein